MFTPFDIWSPIIHAPFSGDMTQEITPRILSPDIKGSAGIEHRIQTGVASFGTQLGKALKALQTLSATTETPLPDIDSLVDNIEAVKTDVKDLLRRETEEALARLKAHDPAAHADLVGPA